MQIIADLQLHSKYARAVSQYMELPHIWEWCRRKGIGLIATGDWTHPLWMNEIKQNLEEEGNGLLKIKGESASWRTKVKSSKHDPRFLLSGEVSCIYSQGGKGRRVHLLIFAPSITTAEKINKELTRRGCNLLSDGRPIIGISSIEFTDICLSIDTSCLVIPAHCLLPDSYLLTEESKSKAIKDFKEGELVLTHTGNYHRVEKILMRNYDGCVYTVKPWYFRPGLTVTPEHPFYAIKTLKRCPSTGDVCRPSKSHLRLCKRKTCLSYKNEWIKAEDLETGDVLVYPRYKPVSKQKSFQISEDVSGFITYQNQIHTEGTRGKKIPDTINLSKDLGLLIGYYLAEGYTDNRDSISFCFGIREENYVRDIRKIMKKIFGIDSCREYRRKNAKSIELTFYSKILSKWFGNVCYSDKSVRKAHTKQIPPFLLEAGYDIQAEVLKGWYRGDKGYTSSRILMNQFKTVCLRLGIIPSLMIDTVDSHKRRGNHNLGNRVISSGYNCFHFTDFSFFEDSFDLKKEIPRSQTKLDRRHGWTDNDYIYIPIKEIEKSDYKGKVYNLEVEEDHSYTSEYACIHNCWTPWFGMYGSESGFDSISECFGKFAEDIYAVETGLSSDPAMNWRIKELDKRSIVSFSDAHSGPKLGRETTVFEMSELSYSAVREAILAPSQNSQGDRLQPLATGKEKNEKSLDPSRYTLNPNHISYSIEFYPEEGKYHFSGHRNCNVKQDPSQTKDLGTLCSVCGKKMTIGVMHRIAQLAGRTEESLKPFQKKVGETQVKGTYSETFSNRPPYIKMVPLQEIIAESFNTAATSQKVQDEYNKIIYNFNSEFDVLLKIPIPDISKIAGERIGEAIDKVRRGDIVVDPGYDGVFGVVKIWKEDEIKKEEAGKEQMSLF